MNMVNLFIDIETYSSIDLTKSGVYRYTEAPDFDILLFGYSVDGAPVEVADLASGESIPEDVLAAITDDAVTKWAFNASFERVCISAWMRKYCPGRFVTYSCEDDTVRDYLDPGSWRDDLLWAAYLGLPRSLEMVGSVLNLKQQKLKEGKDLVRFFSMPRKADGKRNLPADDKVKWELFKAYNKRDVETELAIHSRLGNYPVPEKIWSQLRLSEEINDRGILIDMDLVREAIAMDARSREELGRAMQDITSVANPNSASQMKAWLAEQGLDVDSLGRKVVTGLLGDTEGDVQEALRLRLEIARSSVKKYAAMDVVVCRDGRARGLHRMWYAVSGRWSGTLIQTQNLKRNQLADLDVARSLVKAGCYDAVEMLYGSVPAVLSELVRTALIPKSGHKFIVADFSAIEARVLSYLAGEAWRNKVFAENGDIYCATAERMFHCKVEKHGENAELRQKGKQCELACGYGGSVGALKAMGALEAGMKEEELAPLVESWRRANDRIVKYWWSVDAAVKKAVKEKVPTAVGGVRFLCRNGMLFIELPSGRWIAYAKPRMGTNKFGSESVTYMGIGATKKWERLESFAGRFVENIVQAISRDILAEAMERLIHFGIVTHIHDEVVLEVPDEVKVDYVCRVMGETPEWAPGLVLKADGFETMFYRKD